MRRNQLFFYFLFLTDTLIAQSFSSPHAWISTGKVSARITPTGIHADNVGGFILNSNTPGTPPKNLLSHMTLWTAGTNPGGYLKTACELDDPSISDWEGGFRGKANSNTVWKVSSEQIAMHRADFEDNGIIDNPIQAIYSWPAYENTHSLMLNGFDMKKISYFMAAPYFDKNGSGLYEPEEGDFPYVPIENTRGWFVNSIVFAPFHDNGNSSLSHSIITPQLEGYLVAFTFDCTENDFVKNSIFFKFGWIHNFGIQRLDSVYMGVYADFDIGKPTNDYLGSSISNYKEKLFCYNSDTLNDSFIGANPPILSFMSFDGLIDSSGLFRRVQHFIPVYKGNAFPDNTLAPGFKNEFYNRLNGRWRDGTAMTRGGLGYGGSIIENFAFSDNPTDPDGWSELNENNQKGDRAALISYGPTRIFPDGYSSGITFALTASDKIGLTEQLKHLDNMRRDQGYLFESGWDAPTPLDTIDCRITVKTDAPVSDDFLSIWPSPANDYVCFQSSETGISELTLFDFFGRKILGESAITFESNKLTLDIKALGQGIYILQWILNDGRQGAEKIIIAR